MELIPKKIREQIPPLYATENQNDPIVYLKLFIDGWSWYVTELSMDDDTALVMLYPHFVVENWDISVSVSLKSIRGSLCNNVRNEI